MSSRADTTARRQRQLQAEADAAPRRKAAKKAGGKKKAVQAGARRQPQNPMPAQHLRKPPARTLVRRPSEVVVASWNG